MRLRRTAGRKVGSALVAGALAFTAADRAERQSIVADARRLGAEALRAPDQDVALLLAVAGVHLDGLGVGFCLGLRIGHEGEDMTRIP